MARTIRCFMSDMHLSSQKLYDDGHAWFKMPDHQARLIGFIDQNLLGNAKVKDVVLLGDIFNTWVCPADVKPPSYPDIFKANRKILKKFKELIDDGSTSSTSTEITTSMWMSKRFARLSKGSSRSRSIGAAVSTPSTVTDSTLSSTSRTIAAIPLSGDRLATS